jgi:hypothetical protein
MGHSFAEVSAEAKEFLKVVKAILHVWILMVVYTRVVNNDTSK